MHHGIVIEYLVKPFSLMLDGVKCSDVRFHGKFDLFRPNIHDFHRHGTSFSNSGNDTRDQPFRWLLALSVR